MRARRLDLVSESPGCTVYPCPTGVEPFDAPAAAAAAVFQAPAPISMSPTEPSGRFPVLSAMSPPR